MKNKQVQKIQKPADSMIILPGEVTKHLKNAGVNEIKLLLQVFSTGEFDPAAAAKETGMTEQDANTAFAFWRGAGILQIAEATAETPKPAAAVSLYQSYDSDTIATALESQDEFRNMCDVVGEKLEKLLNKNDYNSLFYLYDYVGLSAEYICGVAAYCADIPKLSMQYLMKTALSLCDEGVDTYEHLERYLAHREQAKNNINKLKKLCGMGDRQMTPRETGFAEKWFGEWNLPFELIQFAYEKTVDATGKVQLAYMNTILKSWYESGFKTVEDVKSGDKKDMTESSFDADEFFEAALKKSMKNSG